MLHLRVLSALIGIPLTILVAWYGNWALWLAIAAVLVIAGLEMNVILRALELKPTGWIIQGGGLIILASAYLYNDKHIGPTIVSLVLVNLLMMAFDYPRTKPVDIFANLAVTLYLGNLVFLYLIRGLPNGWVWILLLFAATWASDTFAYFVGRALGKHKLAPVLSPKKTIEGAVGGVLGSTLIAYAFVTFVPGLPIIPLLTLGLLIGIASLLGDLVESALKRQAKIKDSGQIIPGHGGVLDRFDSMLFTAPLVYYGVKLFII